MGEQQGKSRHEIAVREREIAACRPDIVLYWQNKNAIVIEVACTVLAKVAEVCRPGGRFEDPIPAMCGVGSACCSGDLGGAGWFEKAPETD